MEKIKPELLGFLAAGDLPYRILVVESCDYLPKLRQMYPAAEIHSVVRDAGIAEKECYQGLEIQWDFLDIYEKPLPFARGYFDYIISDLTLEQAGNPQDIAAGFGMFLKETGAWLTSFRNIRHWSVLKSLMEGHFYHIASRLYTASEFERLLCASFYKDVRMRSQKRAGDRELLERLEQAGFSNLHGDMETEFYLVMAARSMPEIALLKSMFSKEQRGRLSRLLHRIEYSVDTAGNCAAFWRLFDEMGLFPDYVAAFVKQAVFFPVEFYRNLLSFSDGRRRETEEIMQLAVRECKDGEERDALLGLLDENRCEEDR